MDDHDLEQLLQDLESDRVERKASIADKDRIRQAICALANDLPNHQKAGVVFVGAYDDGTCAHLSITDQLLLTLADMRSDGNILPFPAMTVQKRTLLGCGMVVIIVQPSDAPPGSLQGPGLDSHWTTSRNCHCGRGTPLDGEAAFQGSAA